MLGASLLVAFALSVVFASGAAAKLPEWGRCVATASGKEGGYSDPGCTVKTPKKGPRSGAYEWAPITHTPLHMTGGEVVFETEAGATIRCAGVGNGSRATVGGNGAQTPFWQFNGCQAEGVECNTGFAYPEEIVDTYAFYEEPEEPGEPTPGWEGKLGYLSGKGSATPSVGLLFKVKNEERLFEPVVCQGPIGTVWIGGNSAGGNSFMEEVTPVNTMTHSFTETLRESAPGVQAPGNFEGRKPRHLEALVLNHWEPVAIAATFEDETELGGLELKATR
jgi:hypothetical protein